VFDVFRFESCEHSTTLQMRRLNNRQHEHDSGYLRTLKLIGDGEVTWSPVSGSSLRGAKWTALLPSHPDTPGQTTQAEQVQCVGDKWSDNATAAGDMHMPIDTQYDLKLMVGEPVDVIQIGGVVLMRAFTEPSASAGWHSELTSPSESSYHCSPPELFDSGTQLRPGDVKQCYGWGCSKLGQFCHAGTSGSMGYNCLSERGHASWPHSQ
jgi:hypothetical protein